MCGTTADCEGHNHAKPSGALFVGPGKSRNTRTLFLRGVTAPKGLAIAPPGPKAGGPKRGGRTAPSGATTSWQDVAIAVSNDVQELGSDISQNIADSNTGGARWTAAANAERDRLLDMMAMGGTAKTDPPTGTQTTFSGPQPPAADTSKDGMSTGTAVALGVGGVAVLGLGAYAMRRKR